jgi:hypothetical protein
VPAGVPEGAPLVRVKEADWPGDRVNDEDENAVGHPAGSLEERPMVLDGQAAESLFVTDAA